MQPISPVCNESIKVGKESEFSETENFVGGGGWRQNVQQALSSRIFVYSCISNYMTPYSNVFQTQSLHASLNEVDSHCCT
jgi:hypothetical protein